MLCIIYVFPIDFVTAANVGVAASLIDVFTIALDTDDTGVVVAAADAVVGTGVAVLFDDYGAVVAVFVLLILTWLLLLVF